MGDLNGSMQHLSWKEKVKCKPKKLNNHRLKGGGFGYD